jgi:GntR family transcriptional regulator, transcriptional repressor for pyruvate dehydrogenase complex
MEKIVFETIKNRKLSEFIESYIRGLILDGKIQPNEKLPTEKEIGEQFGVSLVTVREALKGLEVFGLIEKKKGKTGGIFAREIVSDSAKTALYNFFTLKRFSPHHLSEARLIIEPTAVKIACSNITPTEINDLKKNIESCEEQINQGRATFSEKEFFYIQEKSIEFHRLIAEATHNPILSLTVDYAMEFLFTFKKVILPPDIQY